MGMDFSHKFMEMQAFLSLDWQVAVEEVQQERLAAPDTAPDIDTSHWRLAVALPSPEALQLREGRTPTPVPLLPLDEIVEQVLQAGDQGFL